MPSQELSTAIQVSVQPTNCIILKRYNDYIKY